MKKILFISFFMLTACSKIDSIQPFDDTQARTIIKYNKIEKTLLQKYPIDSNQ